MLSFSLDPTTVALSWGIAVLAAFLALEMAGRLLLARRRAYWAWLAGASWVMGVGIWSMHFTGMMAFQLGQGLVVDHALWPTLGSLAVGVGASGFALWLTSRPTLPLLAWLAGGTSMAIAILGMHHLGLAAMRMQAVMDLSRRGVLVSSAIAEAASLLALGLAFRLRVGTGLAQDLARIGAAIVMGSAITGMHYSSFWGARIQGAWCGPSQEALMPLSLMRAGPWAAAAAGLIVLALLLLYRQRLVDQGKDLGRAQQRLAALAVAAPEALMSWDRDQRITTWTPGAQRLYGYSEAEMLGSSLWDLVREAGRAPTEAMMARCAQGEVARSDRAVALRKDGSLVLVSVSMAPILGPDGRVEGMACAVSDRSTERQLLADLSAAKEAAEAARLQAEAEREAAREAAQAAKAAEAAAEEAREAAEAANLAKSAFLANMSHELRTPLNAILGYAEMLQEDAEAQGWQEANQDLGRILSAGRHLLGLITEVLDLSKIEAGKTELQLEALCLGDVLDDVEATARPLAAANDNRLVVQREGLPESIFADPLKLRQCLLNLLGNACKFTQEGEVRLAVWPMQDPEGQPWLRFAVSDTGIGIAPELQKGLFQPFAQADASVTRRFGGTGLGLALVRHMAQLMGGTVGLSSEAGQGSTFTLDLPQVGPLASGHGRRLPTGPLVPQRQVAS